MFGNLNNDYCIHKYKKCLKPNYSTGTRPILTDDCEKSSNNMGK